MTESDKNDSGKYRWGMVIDLNKCTGCKTCVIACKAENNLQTVPVSEAKKGRINNWINVKTVTAGEYPNAKIRYLPMLCNHCEKPPCTKVCPVRATYLNDEGLVAQIYGRCIGCRYCANACPYTAKTFNWFKPEFSENYKMMLSPDVSVRGAGVVEKCTFCHHRLQQAREKARVEKRELKEGDYIPACAQNCPTDAITFGNLRNKNSKVHKLAKSFNTFRLLEDIGSEPKVTYIAEGAWHE